MSDDRVQQEKELREHQSKLSMEQQMSQLAGQMAAEESQHTIQNPEFLKQLQEPDADTAVWDWLEDEMGPALSGSHIIGQRGDHYEEQQELLNRSLVERIIAERSPGRLLRDKPRLLAIAQGVEELKGHDPDPNDHPAYRAPLTSRKKARLRQLHEIITQRQSLSIGGEGLAAVANATVENRTVSNEEREENGAAGRLSRLYK